MANPTADQVITYLLAAFGTGVAIANPGTDIDDTAIDRYRLVYLPRITRGLQDPSVDWTRLRPTALRIARLQGRFAVGHTNSLDGGVVMPTDVDAAIEETDTVWCPDESQFLDKLGRLCPRV